MKKNEKPKKEQKPQGRVPKQPTGMTELTDQELEQVQGGDWSGPGDRVFSLILPVTLVGPVLR